MFPICESPSAPTFRTAHEAHPRERGGGDGGGGGGGGGGDGREGALERRRQREPDLRHGHATEDTNHRGPRTKGRWCRGTPIHGGAPLRNYDSTFRICVLGGRGRCWRQCVLGTGDFLWLYASPSNFFLPLLIVLHLWGKIGNTIGRRNRTPPQIKGGLLYCGGGVHYSGVAFFWGCFIWKKIGNTFGARGTRHTAQPFPSWNVRPHRPLEKPQIFFVKPRLSAER